MQRHAMVWHETIYLRLVLCVHWNVIKYSLGWFKWRQITSFTTDHHILWLKCMSIAGILCLHTVQFWVFTVGFGVSFTSAHDKLEEAIYICHVAEATYDFHWHLQPHTHTHTHPHCTYTDRPTDVQWGILILYNKWVITGNISLFVKTWWCWNVIQNARLSSNPPYFDSGTTNERRNAKKSLSFGGQKKCIAFKGRTKCT